MNNHNPNPNCMLQMAIRVHGKDHYNCLAHNRLERFCPEPSQGVVVKLTLEDAQEVIALAKARLLHTHPLGFVRQAFKEIKAEFKRLVKKENDLCPFCGSMVKEDSFASSMGHPDSTTWVVDLNCRTCDIGTRIMSSTTYHR